MSIQLRCRQVANTQSFMDSGEGISVTVPEVGKALMLAIDGRMTIVALLLIGPIVLFSLLYFRKVRRVFKHVDEAEGRLTTIVQENLTGIRVVRAFARQDFEREKFKAGNRAHRDLDYDLYCIAARSWSATAPKIDASVLNPALLLNG